MTDDFVAAGDRLKQTHSVTKIGLIVRNASPQMIIVVPTRNLSCGRSA
ncbi:MAG: hypothetical protein JGK24_30145 [Microcoleus sp. PH2017_29_MFU_D_A]|nr:MULTISPECIES: hypothetical protein [unclassified Microcoleus]MCC3418936.1 hypothetical protein [Microcoleus sp. PH2017_07_MST_O_A]MCC3429686.1 hypothetical protein [Microcoleus sp. PH2017_04_SCI_O_A]MCC3442811.1 hypothetical protein [Microcoleus sp. PH2017_03_ELD_O_A]MCC3506481.1 hypothetical protein [Microcoleus sp. PH2017_19_SFW_U_A]MCC3509757.1 hypothetical protein [Microcoleus sp. PH2017_17_BER_D_A]